MYLTITLTGVLVVAICVHALLHRLKYKRRDRILGQLQSPPTYPIVGHVWLAIKSAGDVWNLIENFLVKYETPFVFWAGSNFPLVFTSKLEDIEEMSKKCFHRDVHGLVEETLGDGILVQGYTKWKKIRRLLNMAFGPLMLSQYTCVFNEKARILVDVLKGHADTGESFDATPFLMNVNADMITENMTGVKSSVQRNGGNEFSQAIGEILSITVSRLANPIIHLSCVFRAYMWLTGKNRIIKALHDFPLKALEVARKKVELKYQNNNSRSSLTMPEKPVKSVIEILMAAQNSDHLITDQQMGYEMIHLITAGSETTMLTTGFLLLMLGMKQDIQDKVYNEIIQELGHDGQIHLEDQGKLQYLEQCIRETLRRFTIVSTSIRTTTEDITLPSGKTIPSNCGVLLHFKAVHDNAEYYPNPGQWNPDNFSPEAIAARPKNSFVAFGLGPRSCLGYKYALISIKIQICYILRNYRVHTPLEYEDIKVRRDIIIRSEMGFPLMLTSRSQPNTNADHLK